MIAPVSLAELEASLAKWNALVAVTIAAPALIAIAKAAQSVIAAEEIE